MAASYKTEFIDLCVRVGALSFGRFSLKSGRESPYFFNSGVFDDGERIAALGRAYAAALGAARLEHDMLFGPAYKGIPLVVATATALATEHGRNTPFAFNRKEAKDHGEGGRLVGRPLAGRIAIIDDVITAGTAVRESVAFIREQRAEPCALLIALDRQERGTAGRQSAVQELERDLGLKVVPIITLEDLMQHAAAYTTPENLAALRSYRAAYGISDALHE